MDVELDIDRRLERADRALFGEQRGEFGAGFLDLDAPERLENALGIFVAPDPPAEPLTAGKRTGALRLGQAGSVRAALPCSTVSTGSGTSEGAPPAGR